MRLFLIAIVALSVGGGIYFLRMEKTSPLKQEQEELTSITIGKNAIALHEDPEFPLSGQTYSVLPLDYSSLSHDMNILSGLTGFKTPSFAPRRSLGMRNAIAVIALGQRYIVYDPDWLSNNDARILVMGHEIGHHVCGHQNVGLGGTTSPWQRELEADRYSGSALKRVSFSYNRALAVARAFHGNKRGSVSHPDGASRINAVMNGFLHGSDCENRGYVKDLYVRGTPQEEAEKEQLAQKALCTSLAQDFCSANNLEMKKIVHGSIKSVCGANAGATYIRDGRRYISFPGVDCVNGGRFGDPVKDGIATAIPY